MAMSPSPDAGPSHCIKEELGPYLAWGCTVRVLPGVPVGDGRKFSLLLSCIILLERSKVNLVAVFFLTYMRVEAVWDEKESGQNVEGGRISRETLCGHGLSPSMQLSLGPALPMRSW